MLYRNLTHFMYNIWLCYLPDYTNVMISLWIWEDSCISWMTGQTLSSSEKAQFIVTFITHFAWGNNIYQSRSFFLSSRHLTTATGTKHWHTHSTHLTTTPCLILDSFTERHTYTTRSDTSTCCHPHAKTKTTQTGSVQRTNAPVHHRRSNQRACREKKHCCAVR